MRAQLHVLARRSDAVECQSSRSSEVTLFPSAAMEEPGEVRSRRMLLLERTMYRDGLVPFTSLFALRLRGNLSEPRLRQALAHMQAKHPLLRCVVEEPDSGPRFVLRRQPRPIPLRIVERGCDRDWESEARREWVTPFGPGSDPLVRMVWLRGDGIHELILVAHHCICDGPSGIALLCDCFAAYDDPERASDAYQSLGAIEDLVPGELLQDRAFRSRVRRRSTLLRLALLAKARRRPAADARLRADQMYFHRWQLDPAATASLIARCRDEDTTVLAAVSVAFFDAFREIRGARELKHAYAMVNARRFMPRVDPDTLFGMAPGVEIPIGNLPPPGKMSRHAFWQSARAIRNELTARVDRLGKRYYETLAALETLHDRYPRLIADTEAAPAVRHITFSNLGKLELPRQFGSFQIEHLYSPLVMVSPSPANTVVLSSFGGSIEFSIISDEVSLPQAQAVALREKAIALLHSCSAVGTRDSSPVNRESSSRGRSTP